MNTKNKKLTIAIAVLFEIIIIATSIMNIQSREFKSLYLLLLTIICILLPFIITRIAKTKKLKIPSSFELISLLFIILTPYFGEINKFYVLFWWWDLLLHGMFGSYVVIIALDLIQGIIIKEQNSTHERFTLFTVIFAFSFSITLGTLWELFEFLGDYFFNANMVNGGLEDTASDLLIKTLFAFITCIICYHRKLKNIK